MLGSKKGLLEQIYSFSVFPAPAGINRQPVAWGRWVACVPRASGDKPRALRDFENLVECSPRQRG
ncbi:hypothetical protein D5P94_15370 [Salmonella enterica subsp. enterica]|nr:hypothetical protein [Salmonella enterica subsp. enterica serovar Newport]EAB1532325.1 hypothetical protein [Salmonella enterica]QAZ32417.1 hypothetical protein AW48_04945 [Salmonella enterica subsp. enterica serovar Newport str. CDC 2012K-0938]EAA7202550.1 hypothetical protein [Salmonella enterica subsp. enterica serovar Newport]EAB9682157.1 hypothetical protein [Salmonella enterica subsp. enterica serovar Newport]